jgi:hypothetical protein
MKKRSDKSFSFTKTTTSYTSSVSVGGKRIDFDSLPDDAAIIAELQEAGLDSDLISQTLDALKSSRVDSRSDNQINAQEKVECQGCKRTVAFAKGSCMYCGTPLELDQKSDVETNNPVDAKFLDSDPVEQKSEEIDEEFIARLKDL